MSEQIMLENKRILIGGNEYRLSIIKNIEQCYEAHLSDVNSQFTAKIRFYALKEVENKLMDWLRAMNAQNDPELRVFDTIKKWDGVVML
ncbi:MULTISPECIES: hypothetical protein [unclassified Oceanobacillus]|uniref:hypothetical protein n=1 Tax=unclassified Oceanobacillus TaxID=2630292 RepID=UPI00300DE3B5